MQHVQLDLAPSFLHWHDLIHVSTSAHQPFLVKVYRERTATHSDFITSQYNQKTLQAGVYLETRERIFEQKRH